MNSNELPLQKTSRWPPQRWSFLMALAGALSLTAVAVALLCLRLLPMGIEGQWQWPWREEALRPGRPAVAALAALLLAALVALDRLRTGTQPSRRICAALLTMMVVLAAISMTVVGFNDPAFWLTAPAVVASDTSMGYYGQALRMTTARELFASHNARAMNRAQPYRVRTHPPGPILYFAALRNLFLSRPGLLAWVEEQAQAVGLTPAELRAQLGGLTSTPLTQLDALVALPMGLLISLPAALVCLPVFGLCAVISDRRVGLIAAALSLAIPSLLVFIPSVDAMPALLAALLVYLWLLALRSGSLVGYALCGVAGAGALLWTYGLAAMAVPMLVLAGILWRQDRVTGGMRRLAGGLFAATVAFVILYVMIYLWSGYSFPLAMWASLAAHREVMVAWQRSYLGWLPGNLYDFLLFAGPALSFLWLWSLVVSRRGGQPIRLGAAVGWSVGALLVVLLLLGTTRGEVGRIWVFIMPLMVPSVAERLARLREGHLLGAGTAVIVAQAGFALCLASYLSLVRPY